MGEEGRELPKGGLEVADIISTWIPWARIQSMMFANCKGV